MSRYLAADFKRIFEKKYNLIFIFLLFSFIALIDGVIAYQYFNSGSEFGVAQTLNFGSVSISTARDNISGIFMLLAFNAIFATSFIVMLIMSTLVMGDEQKERGFLRAVESGISRTDIVIVKFILLVAVSFILLIGALIFHFVLVAMLFGMESENILLIKEFIKIFSLYIIPLINLLALSELLYIAIKQELLVGFLYAVVGIILPNIIKLLLTITNIRSEVVLKILSYHPASILTGLNNTVISSVFMKEGMSIYKVVPDLSLKIFVNAALTMILIVMCIFTMNRRNLD